MCVCVCVCVCVSTHACACELQEKRTIAAGAKTAAICRLLWRVFGPLLYMRSIAVFFVTAAIDRY